MWFEFGWMQWIWIDKRVNLKYSNPINLRLKRRLDNSLITRAQ
jgi:hypothetical protein